METDDDGNGDIYDFRMLRDEEKGDPSKVTDLDPILEDNTQIKPLPDTSAETALEISNNNKENETLNLEFTYRK